MNNFNAIKFSSNSTTRRIKEDNHSSFDSEISEDETERNTIKLNQKNNLDLNKIAKIKNQLENRPKGISDITKNFEKVDWGLFYKKISEKDLDINVIHKKQIEVRINSALNNINKFGIKDNHHVEKILKQNLHTKNEYINGRDKINKFVPLIISKFNEYQEKRKKTSDLKNIKIKYNKLNTLSKNKVKKETSRSLKDLRNEKNKQIIHLSEGELRSKCKLRLENDNNDPKNNFNLQNDFNDTNVPLSTKNSSSFLRNSMKYNYKKQIEKKETMDYFHNFKDTVKLEVLINTTEEEINNPYKILITDSKLKDCTRQQEQDIKNLKLDIKSYEKELSRINNIFNTPKYRELNHFFTFEDTKEALRHTKPLCRFQSKEKLDLNKTKVDFLIKKIIND